MAFHNTVLVGDRRVDVAIADGSIWMTFRDLFGDKHKESEVSLSKESAIGIATMLLNAVQKSPERS